MSGLGAVQIIQIFITNDLCGLTIADPQQLPKRQLSVRFCRPQGFREWQEWVVSCR
jgi:hypothetical protein